MHQSIKYFIVGFCFWSLALVSVNYVVDPLQYYRLDNSPRFVKNQRYQIPGLIRNYNFDTIFVGTSHSENFLASQLDKFGQTQSINLSISGSSAWEQMQVVNLASQQGELANVVWEMNYKSFAGANPNQISAGKFPQYLFQQDYTTPFYYLYSIDTLVLTAKKLIGKGIPKLDGLNAWYPKEKHKFDGVHVLKHYCSRVSQISDKKTVNYSEKLNQYLLPVLQNNPNVNFYLFLPPLSVANFALNNQVQRYIAFRKALYQSVKSFSNIAIIDYTTDYGRLSQLTNYKDVEHYNLDISNQILSTVATTQVNVENNTDINKFNQEILEFVEHWKSENECGVNIAYERRN